MKQFSAAVFVLIAVGLLCFMGCSKDSGTKYDKDDLIGTWQAVEEVLDLSSMNMGKITLTPTNSLFLSLIFEVKEDGSFTYETWNGPDKNAEGADYSQGTGSWTATGSEMSMDFDDPEEPDISGTYKFLSKNKLEVEATITTTALGPTALTVPATLIVDRVTS